MHGGCVLQGAQDYLVGDLGLLHEFCWVGDFVSAG